MYYNILMVNTDSGVRAFTSNHFGGQVLASRIELRDAQRVPGTLGWLSRFSLITAGETAEKWPTVNATYVLGVIDGEGSWIADFPEPTIDNPTVF